MHWDVVEIKPEADYWLFLRFKDGLSGRVRLDPEEFTGVLAPLGNIEFFNRVYIDGGAPAWPATSIWLAMPFTGESQTNATLASAPPDLAPLVQRKQTPRE